MTELVFDCVDGQLSFLEPPEHEALKAWYRLNNPDLYMEISAGNVEQLPDGTELIVVELGSDYKTGARRNELNRYCRCIVGRVDTGRMYSMATRLYVEPDAEWQARPRWQSWGGGGKQWGYVDHGWRTLYFIRKEVSP